MIEWHVLHRTWTLAHIPLYIAHYILHKHIHNTNTNSSITNCFTFFSLFFTVPFVTVTGSVRRRIAYHIAECEISGARGQFCAQNWIGWNRHRFNASIVCQTESSVCHGITCATDTTNWWNVECNLQSSLFFSGNAFHFHEFLFSIFTRLFSLWNFKPFARPPSHTISRSFSLSLSYFYDVSSPSAYHFLPYLVCAQAHCTDRL